MQVMFNRLKLLGHRDHSGRLRPHEHTSYFPLGIVLVLVGFALITYSVSAQSPGPQEGSVGLTGVVPGEAPTKPAVIKSPTNGQHFDTSPITVSGTCPKDTLVEILKSNIFAGSTFCSKNGTFSLDIDLLFGKNVLMARVYDSLNQPGPDSETVTVIYDVLPPQTGPLANLSFDDSQLLLNTDAVYRGVFPKKEFHIPIEVLGGTPPYAVNIQWGDTSNKVVPRHDNVAFRVEHMYQQPGTYQISLQAADALGRVAFLTVAAIVNGQPEVVAASGSGVSPNQLLLLWPVYTGAVAVVASFWLGEQREKRVLKKHGLLITPEGQT
jgi:hypothetical protein